MRAIAVLTVCAGLIGGLYGASAQQPALKTAPTGPLLSSFKIGNWDGGAFADPGNTKFSYCAGVAPYQNGVTLAFVLNNSFEWGIALIDPAWKLNTGAAYPVELAVDNKASGLVSASAIGTSEVLISLKPTVALFKTFMEGERMTVQAASGNYVFDLTKTSEMLPDLLRCVEAYAGAAPANSNPFVNTSD
jgi:hypothetical protein